MSLHEIIERFALVSGFGMDEVSRYLPLLGDCKALFEERIKGELSPVQRRRAAYACAVYAYYRICLLLRDGGLKNYRAGDVQMIAEDIDDTVAAAERMWNEEKDMIADFVDFDGGFAFRSVRI